MAESQSKIRHYKYIEMSQKQCQRLIELYASHRTFWDPKVDYYLNKNMREEAWRNISEEMDMPVEDLKRKMESLLGSYRREKSREKKSRLNGGPEYTSNWYAFRFFDFMADKHLPEREGQLEGAQINEDDGESSEYQAHYFDTADEEPLSTFQPKRLKRSPFQEIYDVPIEPADIKKEAEDVYDVFTKLVGLKIRKIKDEMSREILMNDILNLVFKAVVKDNRNRADDDDDDD